VATTTAPSVAGAFFPLDEALGLLRRTAWSPQLLRMVTKLVARVPYAEAGEVLAELGQVQVATSSSWHIGQDWGARIEQELAREVEAQKVAAREWSTPGGRPDPQLRMGLAVDGAMVYVLKEGWKEFKVGTVYKVVPEKRTDEVTGDIGEYGHAVDISYVAHLGGPEALGWKVWAEAQRRGWAQACATQMLGDGSAWIWGLHQEHFHTSVAGVDWWHALEHLGEAKLLLYPQPGPTSSRWYNEHKTVLYQGHAERITQSLQASADQEEHAERATELRKAGAYFRNNRDRMHYQDMRDEGWPIGSGAVESGAKQFKARFTGPGMRWSRQGAENLLPVRAAVLAGKDRFNQLWSRAYSNLPPS